MSSCNVLQSTGSDFCGTNNFQGIFAHFRFMMFIQERINMYVDPCNCKVRGGSRVRLIRRMTKSRFLKKLDTFYEI